MNNQLSPTADHSSGRNLVLLVLILFITGIPAARADDPGGDEIVVPADCKVLVKSEDEWAAAWWNWVASVPKAEDVVNDPTGANTNNNQTQPIFMLGGTGTAPGTRHFEVPSGVPIAVPLITITYWRTAGEDPAQIQSLVENSVVDYISQLWLTLDGKTASELQIDLFSHRVGTFFTGVIAPGSSTNLDSGEPAGTWRFSYVGGYFAILNPLAPGEHTLDFGGLVTGGPLAGNGTSVTSTITVAEPPEVRITAMKSTPAGMMLSWVSSVATSHEVRYRETLESGTWTVIATVPTGEFSYTDQDSGRLANPRGFYQIAASLAP